ncbi:MAG: TetR/AcrR family transcriptional regulator [Shewanella sp.]|nr:TetR/AcrR family transcriptional regulator [Shewanella sp.]MCF1429516.1 TetR/AcrR family transcriptional regulator [Shewanella sp.]MCF1439759.1 TetR/AcrR family transcriptional regulator [Shewanella sp.]MCF1457700.1 TetR/AcrR family transcriptional regulator [Shewanella sp.]
MRTAEFDRQQVLAAAMNAFICKGFSKTSMQDLKQATGLHPGSIYCAFTNKRGLLLAALEHYRAQRSTEFETFFAGKDSVLDGIEAYLAGVLDECERDEIKDCLLQKALSELAHQDEEVEALIGSMLTDWQSAFTEKLRQAQRLGELAEGRDCEALSQFLVMGIYGMRTYAHTKPAKGILASLAGQLMIYIRG